MMKLTVLTGWTGNGIDIPHHPQIADVYALGWTDITSQPSENIVPTVNAFVIEALCEDETFALIETDPNYCVLSAIHGEIIESEFVPDED
jgi:hypothetical protein